MTQPRIVSAEAPATPAFELSAFESPNPPPAMARVRAAAPRLTMYVVESGDTLRLLAERFGVSVATIAAANKLPDPNVIRAGQELVVLPTTGVLHTIKPGDTLGQVASRYGVELAALASANEIEAVPDELVVGETLVVPGIEPALAEQAPASKPAVAQAEPHQGDAAQQSTTATAAAPVLANRLIGPADGEAAASPAVEKPAPKSPLMYEVQDGDNLKGLATQFGVNIATILMANNISDPDLITPGTQLRVLPVSGVEHEVAPGESLADIAAAYHVDLGPMIDFNGLTDPDVVRAGEKLLIPGATARATTAVAQASVAPSSGASAAPSAAAPSTKLASQAVTQSSASAAVAPKPAAAPASGSAAAPASVSAAVKPSTQAAIQSAAKPAAAPAAVKPAAVPAPVPVSAAGGGSIVGTAMNYVGARYVFGGTSPAGFDCSGFIWYVHKAAGISTSRGLWGQLNGGPRIARENLQPGDSVFFANTYMPGLSHAGIYIGGGRFVHAIDESRGVGVSSLGEGYWSSRYVGASRIR